MFKVHLKRIMELKAPFETFGKKSGAGRALPAVNLIETLAKPFMERIGTMMTIDIVKRE